MATVALSQLQYSDTWRQSVFDLVPGQLLPKQFQVCHSLHGFSPANNVIANNVI